MTTFHDRRDGSHSSLPDDYEDEDISTLGPLEHEDGEWHWDPSSDSDWMKEETTRHEESEKNHGS